MGAVTSPPDAEAKAAYQAWLAEQRRAAKPRAKPRPWIVAAVLVWVVILGAAATWAILDREPTARDQTTVTDAIPVLDRAASTIVAAVEADGQSVAAISGLTRVADCSISVVRAGERYQRVVTVVVAPGTEEALLTRLAAGLPGEWDAVVRTGTAPRLSADAGFFVAVNATVAGPGAVRFVVDSGDCRAGGPVTTDAGLTPTADQRALVASPLGLLGSNAQPMAVERWHVYRAACPSGQELVTIEAEGPARAAPESLEIPFAVLSSDPVVRSPDLVAYRVDGVGVTARTIDDRVVVTATVPCAG